MVVALYRHRWGIETHYNHLKTSLEMAALRSKTPENIHREIVAILLAHNPYLDPYLRSGPCPAYNGDRQEANHR